MTNSPNHKQIIIPQRPQSMLLSFFQDKKGKTILPPFLLVRTFLILFLIALSAYTSLSFRISQIIFFGYSIMPQFFIILWRLILLIARALHTVHGFLEYLRLDEGDLLVQLALKYLILFAWFCFRCCVCVFTLAAQLSRFLAQRHYSLPLLYALDKWRQFGFDLIQPAMLGRVVFRSFLGCFRTSNGRMFLIHLNVVALPIRLSFKTHACAHIDYRFWIYYKRLDNQLILKHFSLRGTKAD